MATRPQDAARGSRLTVLVVGAQRSKQDLVALMYLMRTVPYFWKFPHDIQHSFCQVRDSSSNSSRSTAH